MSYFHAFKSMKYCDLLLQAPPPTPQHVNRQENHPLILSNKFIRMTPHLVINLFLLHTLHCCCHECSLTWADEGRSDLRFSEYKYI